MTPAPSHVSGATEPPLLDLTIGELLASAATRQGATEALVSVAEDVRMTYAELDGRVTRLAAGLVRLGLARGDRIGIWSPNNVWWVLVQLAAARAGLILVTINPAYRTGELEHALALVGVRAIVAAERFKTSDYPAMVEAVAPRLAGAKPDPRDDRLPELRYAIKIGGAPRAGWHDVADLAGDDGPAGLPADLSATDPANIQFTSGTTGSPKGATLTHHNIVNNAAIVGAAMGLRAGDRLCVPVPLYHCFGLVMGTLACIARGATMVLPAPGFDPAATLRAITDERCTHVHGVPTMFIALLARPELDGLDLGCLRGGIMAGAPCPTATMREVIGRLAMTEVTIAYGMTETSPVSFQTAPHDAVQERIETVGRVQPHLECRLVDHAGRTVPRGTVGELRVRGYSVMRGYWGEPDRTAEAIDADGWMRTGDLATLDDRGYCCIVGRLKDMVIRGGENIYPAEIEEFIARHPAVAEVAVVGVPDARLGEALCAWIRLKTGGSADAAGIADFCRDRIAHYKIPRDIRFVDALPMTVTGKVRKMEIRRLMTATASPDAEDRP